MTNASPEPPLQPPAAGRAPGGSASGILTRWAWVPIPVLLLAILALWAADWRGSYPAPWLTFTLQLVFMTLTSGLIVYWVSQSFLASGAPGLWLLGCGVVTWGLSGVVAGRVSGGDVNVSVTIHNLCVWMAALYHLMGVLLSGRPQRISKERGWWLLVSYGLTMGLIALVAVAATEGRTPEFFIQGDGGTLVRQIVLGSAIVMFVLSAVLLRGINRRERSSFTQWYGLGLLLIATGLFGVLLQSVHSSVLGWVGVSTQWLSGVYLGLAAFVAARDSKSRAISFAVVPSDWRLRYGLVFVFVAAMTAVRLVFFQGMGTDAPYVTLYPAVVLAALYGGRGPAMVATGLSALVVDFFWLEPVGEFKMDKPGDWEGMVLFLVNALIIALIVGAMQRAQRQASLAETELKLAVQREQAEEALRESTQRTANILNSITSGYQVIDREGRFVQFNAAARKMFAAAGRDTDSLIGQHVFEGFPDGREAAGARTLFRTLAERVPTETESFYEAWQTWFHVRNYPTTDGGVATFFEDITERKRTEEALRAAHEQLGNRAVHLEKLVQSRTTRLDELVGDLEAFSYSMVHDMRAPLRAMQSFAQLLAVECGPLNATAENYVRRIQTAAERMDHLIQDGLSYSRVMRAELPLGPTDAGALLRGIAETYPAFQPPHATIEWADSWPLVRANATALTQCLANLMDNAVKFVAPGVTPRVRAWAEARDGRVRLFFQDNGLGIAPEAHEKIFQIFERLDHQYEGTGIGLALVKKAAARMGGRVGVESAPGRGSTFWLELAAANDEPTGAASPAGPAPGGSAP